jgi:hypothetical protein
MQIIRVLNLLAHVAAIDIVKRHKQTANAEKKHAKSSQDDLREVRSIGGTSTERVCGKIVPAY